MGTEIERKFLVVDDAWRAGAVSSHRIRQGYLCLGPPTAIRVRLVDGTANLNIKKATLDISRSEFEYTVPVQEAEEILAHLCQGHLLLKTRYRVPQDDLCWEIDVFEGVNAGLTVAEIELPTVDTPFHRPSWVGDEVSGDPRYLNSCLAIHPYSEWGTRAE